MVAMRQDTELAVGQKNDPAGAGVGPYGHGPTGLFNRTNLQNPLLSAIMLPIGGILDALPVYNAGMYSNDEFGGEDASFDTMITGVTSGAGDLFANQPTGDCVDGPVGGLTKLCKVANTFGRYRFGVREVSMYRAGRRDSMVDPLGLQVLNSPLMQQVFGMASNTPTIQNAITNEWSRRFMESAISARRMFARRVFSGSPANNSGERKDIVGLDIWINSGNKVDADMSAVCTAADSYISNFNLNLVNGPSTAFDIVKYIEYAMDFVNFKAQRQGLTPFTGVIVMRPELWNEIANVWPVREFQFALAQIGNFNANSRVVIDARETYDARTAMLQNMMLPIKGIFYPVVLDDGITEFDVTTKAGLAAGQYSSDIYFIPLTVMGGYPVTFLEHFNHDNAQAQALQKLAGMYTFTTDGGTFRWYVNFKNGCLNATWEFSPRLRVRATQLGWRITNVAYAPLAHFASPFPDSSYFANGGVVEGNAGTTFYAQWSTTTKVSG